MNIHLRIEHLPTPKTDPNLNSKGAKVIFMRAFNKNQAVEGLRIEEAFLKSIYNFFAI